MPTAPAFRAAGPVALALLAVSCAAPRAAIVGPIEPALREELLALHGKRVSCLERTGGDLLTCGAIDDANALRLKEIVERYGWPGRALVGDDGAFAAFMVLQHSPDSMLPFQELCLPLLHSGFLRGEVTGQAFALLTDRVLVRRGQPQRYGSQFRRTERGLEPYPMEDPENVDTRRAEMGLGPLAEDGAGFDEPAPAP